MSVLSISHRGNYRQAPLAATMDRARKRLRIGGYAAARHANILSHVAGPCRITSWQRACSGKQVRGNANGLARGCDWQDAMVASEPGTATAMQVASLDEFGFRQMAHGTLVSSNGGFVCPTNRLEGVSTC